MKHIVLFGAGRSATELIDYLKQLSIEKGWKVTVVDQDSKTIAKKVGFQNLVQAKVVDIENDSERKALIQQADIVISLLPPTHHYLLASDCILFHKNLLTASYVDEKIKALEKDIQHRQLLFLYEMGLDPGIDHMSAMQQIDKIIKNKGVITSFKSYCGGLVAPETDNNPWHYKITWNPRNIVLAGKTGAIYKKNDSEIQVPYEELFNGENLVEISPLGKLAFYPNRDSLNYASLYQLEKASSFLRATLRHPAFCFGWKNIVHLRLTDEEKKYDTNGLTVADFFKQHFSSNGFEQWFNDMMMSRLKYVKGMVEELTDLIQSEQEEDPQNENYLIVDEEGKLSSLSLEDVKNQAAESMANEMEEANLTMKQLFFLGLDDTTELNLGLCSAADVLQFLLEKKLALLPGDKDMIVMMHDIEYAINGEKHAIKSSLIVKGENNLHTAMAKTVGLPLGIAAKLILEGEITEVGLHIPISASIYEPVLKELKKHGIRFEEVLDK